MYHIEDWKPLPGDIEAKSTWHGHSKTCAVDAERGLVVRWVSGSRDIYRHGWLFQHGQDLVEFETHAHEHAEGDNWFADLRFAEFGYSQIVDTEFPVGSFAFPTVEMQREWLRLATEGVLVCRDETRSKFRSPYRTRVFLDGVPLTLSDFGYAEFGVEPLTDGASTQRHRSLTPIPKENDSALPMPTFSTGPEVLTFRLPPVVVGSSILAAGGMKALCDIRIGPADGLVEWWGRPGVAVDPEIARDAITLRDGVPRILAAARVARTLKMEGPQYTNLLVADAIASLIWAGDVSKASEVIQSYAVGVNPGAVAMAMGLAAAMLGAAPLGWVAVSTFAATDRVELPTERHGVDFFEGDNDGFIARWMRVLMSRVVVLDALGRPDFGWAAGVVRTEANWEGNYLLRRMHSLEER